MSFRTFQILALSFLIGRGCASMFDGLPLEISCAGAPQQYKDAGKWIDAGKEIECSPDGKKGYLFYSDGIVGK